MLTVLLPLSLSLAVVTAPDVGLAEAVRPSEAVWSEAQTAPSNRQIDTRELLARVQAAAALVGQGDCQRADRELAALLPEVQAVTGADSELALEVLGSRALALECAGQSAQATALAAGRYQQTLDSFGPDSWTTDMFRMLEAYRVAREGRVDEALLLMRASFDLRLRSPRANASEREQLGALLGAIYRSRGREDEAREVLALSGASGPATDLTALYSAQGQGQHDKVIEVAGRMLANPDLALPIQQMVRTQLVYSLQAVGVARRDAGLLERAEAEARTVLAHAGSKPEMQAAAARALGLTLTSNIDGYASDARYDEGLALLRQAVETTDKAFGIGVPLGVDARLDLAARLQARDRSQEAEAVLAPLVEMAEREPLRLNPDARATVAVGQALAAVDTRGLAPAYDDMRRAAIQRQDMILARSSRGEGRQARQDYVDLFRAQVAFAWFLAEDLGQ